MFMNEYGDTYRGSRLDVKGLQLEVSFVLVLLGPGIELRASGTAASVFTL